jgi:hypothetical protein
MEARDVVNSCQQNCHPVRQPDVRQSRVWPPPPELGSYLRRLKNGEESEETWSVPDCPIVKFIPIFKNFAGSQRSRLK